MDLLPWNGKYPLTDGAYEIKARSQCALTGREELDYYSTEVIQGWVDREKPLLYGFPSPSFENLFPNQEVSFSFSEAIDCQKPYSFLFDVSFSNLNFTYTNTDLSIICREQEGTISFRLPKSAPYDVMFGSEVLITLDGVSDLNSNVIEFPNTTSIKFCRI